MTCVILREEEATTSILFFWNGRDNSCSAALTLFFQPSSLLLLHSGRILYRFQCHLPSTCLLSRHVSLIVFLCVFAKALRPPRESGPRFRFRYFRYRPRKTFSKLMVTENYDKINTFLSPDTHHINIHSIPPYTS